MRAKPELPQERARVPREVFQDVRGAAPRESEDVLRALGGAEHALESGDAKRAIELLEWAKSAAARSWAVREALGIAYYLAGKYREAHRELLTYRRLSGQEDQNHLLADCARAFGDAEKARQYVDAMIERGVDAARVIEGLLVVAGDRAERGDVDGALRTLDRADAEPGGLGPDEIGEQHLRLWYLRAELHERRGERDKSQRLRQAIADIDPDLLAAMDT